MTVGSAAERPMVLDTEPVPAVVVPFVGETHGDAVVAERPYLLDQPVIKLLIPLAPKERLDGLAALQELCAITPAAADGIGQRHLRRITRVPGVPRPCAFSGPQSPR